MTTDETFTIDSSLLKSYKNQLNNIKQHSDVSQSLTTLMNLITDLMTGNEINNAKWLKLFVTDNLLQHIINDMIYYKQNHKQKHYFIKLQHHILLMNYLFDLSELSPIPFNIKPIPLFETFIINANNQTERFIMLETFISFWRAHINYNQLQTFYNKYLKPLMKRYSCNNNYEMVTNIYYCFSIYYMNYHKLNNSIGCLKYLKLNNTQITKFIMHQLRKTIKDNNTHNKLKLHHLLHTLKDIFISTEKPLRVPLINNNNKLTNKMKAVLKTIFEIFATRPNGSMCYNDMRRYIVSCGIKNTSNTRIRQIFNYKEQLDFNGFCNFYKVAILRNVDYVWNDIIHFGYKYDLEPEWNIKNNINIINGNNQLSVRDIIANDKDYLAILNKYFENHETDNNWQTFEMMISLPKCYELQQKMYDLNIEHEKVKFYSNNLYKMVYGVLVLNGIINRLNESDECEKWKELFIKKRKLDCLTVILLTFYIKTKQDYKYYKDHEGYELGRSLLFKIMYWIEKSYLNKQVNVHVFIGNKLAKFNGINIFNDEEINSIMNMKKNNFIQMICLLARKMKYNDLCMLKVSKLIDLMPTEILKMYAKPLVFGFVRNYATTKCQIPFDMSNLILIFFC